jgi:O-antigen/teichoic acid export membrane protein
LTVESAHLLHAPRTKGEPLGTADSTRRIAFATVLQLFARIAGLAMGVGVAAFLARGLGTTDFGRFSLLLALVSVAVNVGDFGLSQVAVREMSIDPNRRAAVAGGLAVARLSSGLVLAVVVGVAGSVLLSTREGTIAAALVAATLPLGALASLQAVAQARLRPHVMSALTLVQSAAWLAGVAALAAFHAPLSAYASVFLAVALLQGVLAVKLTASFATVDIAGSHRIVLELLRRAWLLGVAGLFVTAYYRFDAVLLFRLAGSDQTALYGAAYRFLDVLQVLPATAVGLLLPILSSLRGRSASESFGKAFTLALGLLIASAAPVVAAGMVLARPIIGAIYGPSFAGAAPVLVILLPSFLSISVGYVLTTVILAADRIRVFCVITGAVAVLSVAANIVLIPLWGARAAAATTLVTEFSASFVVGLVVVRGLGLRIPWSRCARVAASTALMVGVAFTLRGAGLAVALGGSAAVYVGAAILLRAVDIAQVRRLLAPGAIVAR